MFFCRLQDTPQHTHHQTADGTKPPAALKAVRPQVPLPVPACGTPRLVTHLLVLPPPAETPLATLLQATAEPPEVFAKTAGMRPPKPNERPQDMAAAGPKRHVQTGGTSPWARLRPQGPAKGNLGGMKPQPVRWDPQHRYLPQERLL